MVKGSEDLVFDPLSRLKPHVSQGVAGNLVLDPMGSISCGMVKEPTSLASDPSEIRLCAHREQIQLLSERKPIE